MSLRVSEYVAFLRGMNVGGHRLTNEELRGHFMAMGFAEVATFRASGNVVFAAQAEPPRVLQPRIEAGLASLLGYAVPTFIRSDAEVRVIAAMQPFTAERLRRSSGKLQVSLLSASPSPQAHWEILSLASEEDGLVFGERELYWLPSGGLLESALDLDRIDRLLGTTTRRTKNTIEQIAERHCG